MSVALYFLLAFLVGSIPTGLIVSSWIKKVDLRQHGSGNIGATNAFRVLGRGYGLLVLGLDFLKGYLPVIILSSYVDPLHGYWLGMSAILGHIFTPFLRFKGGKGIATGAGVLAAAFPLYFFLTLGVWILTMALSRIVSISSLVALGSIFVINYFRTSSKEETLFFLAVLLLIVWTHRANIQRLYRGEEKRLF